jgi:glycosyltransferase involved in cell wall biosynthesis
MRWNEGRGVDIFAGDGPVRLGSTALEDILCRVSPVGVLSSLVPHAVDAWSIEFGGLDRLPAFEGDPARLRICIATEDIVGPVRNGGIGTTYSALAELLARLGHEVTILYLKGNDVENGTIEQWIDFYAAKSVRFVPVPNYAAADRFTTGADRWLHAPYNMLKYLTDHPMDVVHVSEWRGSGYLSLLAKRQRLAFQQTLFIVKTSSPWIWNRLYGSQPLDRLDDLAKVHAERRSVEFADIVIGGSLHLLRWMSSQGYRIPRDRTFVQPNVATFDHLADLLSRRNWTAGTRYPVDELVFFGRLEARKGLLTFVQAIKRLLRQGTTLPRQITFMGKPGARLMARPDQDILDYIKAETANWPTKVEILSEFQQYEALQYLLNGDRLAIMPSMIENSSLAVYEAAICGIPFIASNSGGTPELIAAIDHPEVLCDAHPIPLAARIADALDRGGYVARPSFDNDVNLETWRRFHLDLGRGLLEKLVEQEQIVEGDQDSVSVCIYHADTDEKLRATLLSVKEQDHAPSEVLIAVDTDDTAAVERAEGIAKDVGLTVRLVPTFDYDAGQSFNVLAGQASSEFVFFLWAGATIRPLALRALTKVAASSNADLVNYFFRVTHQDDTGDKDYLSAIVFGNVAQSFFRGDVTSLPLLVRRRTFAALEGFTTDYRVLAHDHELVAKAQISGVHCETALLELGSVPAWEEEWLKARCYDQGIAQFRAIRPELAATPLALRELLLMAKGLQKGGVRRGRAPGRAARPQRVEVEREGPLGRLMTALSNDLLATETAVKEVPAAKAREPAARPARPARPERQRERHREDQLAVADKALRARPAPARGGANTPGVDPRVVARAARLNAKAARAGGMHGAGLVQLIDQLSADSIDEEAAELKKPAATRPRVSDPRPPIKRPEPRQITTAHMLSNLPGKRFSGRVLGIHDGVAYGWVRNEEQPQDPVELEIFNGRGASDIVRAEAELPTVLPMPPEIRNRGFVLPLWRGWRTLQRYRKVKHLDVRIKGTDIHVGLLSAQPDPGHLSKAGFDGYCDIIDATVRGWVWQPSEPEVLVDVSVFVDGKFLARATADDLREDLRAAQIGNGAYGFSISLPQQLRDGTPRNVDVVVADTGTLLNRGRLRLVGNSLTAIE